MNRIKGLDSIRFVCALIVVFDHFGAPWSFLYGLSDSWLLDLLRRGSGVLFNGPAAVIVFFVVSGMCIHLPFARGKSLQVPSYFVRRLVRIGVPSLVTAAIYISLDQRPHDWNDTVLWSIFCELIYYTLYPLLLLLRFRLGWWLLIGTSYLAGLAMALLFPEKLPAVHNSYVAFGWWTWVLGLPCWLLGCSLAEDYPKFPAIGSVNIWLVRGFVFSISVLLKIAKFHAPTIFASNVYTLNVFAFLAFIWIGLEIAYLSQNGAWNALEKAGLWSYSLYLIHPITPAALSAVGLYQSLNTQTWLGVVTILASLVLSYIFFLVCERPSHWLAVYLAAKMQSTSQSLTSHLEIRAG